MTRVVETRGNMLPRHQEKPFNTYLLLLIVCKSNRDCLTAVSGRSYNIYLVSC